MIYKIADNIFSPLGQNTKENYTAIKNGMSGLSLHEGLFDISEAFMVSMFDKKHKIACSTSYSFFIKAILLSIRDALNNTDIDITNDNVVLIISTAKGDIDSFKSDGNNPEYLYLGTIAQLIANELGIKTTPIVVCNACVSGLTAIILAERLLDRSVYDYAIVCGCDILSKFVVSGFQSLFMLSKEECRPFDMERTGLNLGEAAATIIFSKESPNKDSWAIEDGIIRNDAHHISTPSKNADGLYLALSKIIKNNDKENLALINAHGTGTLFNDQMEAVAINRSGLSEIPINALKGYFGHTMGVAGILETILTMWSLDEGVILGTRGFTELGISSKLNISNTPKQTDKKSFIKILSGFGSCNAVIMASKDVNLTNISTNKRCLKQTNKVIITPLGVSINEYPLEIDSSGTEILTQIYKRYISDYPKFYKMDMLCRLGFVASELLLKVEGGLCENKKDGRAVILFNRSGSLSADKEYLKSIDDENYYPSPSIFVYTLPNIITGEIAIRNGYHGETAFYVLPRKDENLMSVIMGTLAQDSAILSVMGGWLEFEDNKHFEAEISLYELK